MRRIGIPLVLAVLGLALVSLFHADVASALRSINCASEGGRYRYCPAQTYGSARIDKKFSDAPCTFGKSWGYDAKGVWVSNGCRALFVLGEPSVRPPIGGGRITCESMKGKRAYCRVSTRGQVRLVEQLSKAPCTLGYTWGWDDGGIWVDRGCRGEFIVGRGSKRSRIR